MNDQQIVEMLKEVVGRVDYDIYKNIFVPECREYPDEEYEELIGEMIAIVRQYVGKG